MFESDCVSSNVKYIVSDVLVSTCIKAAAAAAAEALGCPLRSALND